MQLLFFALSPEERAKMSMGGVKQSVIDKRLYLFGTDATYRIQPELRASLSDFKKETASSTAVSLEDVTASTNLLVGCLKAKLANTNMVFSLPEHVFGAWVAGSLGHTAAGHIREVVPALAAMEPDWASTAATSSLRFFVVVNCRPELRRLVQQPHLQSSRSLCTIAPLRLVLAAGATLALENDCSSQLTLSLLPLCSLNVLASLFAWSESGIVSVARLAPKLQQDLDAALEVVSVAPPPISDSSASTSALVVLEGDLHDQQPAGEQSILLGPLPRLVQKMAARNCIVGAGGRMDAIELLSISGASSDALELLHQLGAVEKHYTDFGEAMLALKPLALQWHPVVQVSEACHVLRLPCVDPLGSVSKVELAMALIFDGWEFAEELGERHGRTSPRRLSSRMLQRPARFEQCMFVKPLCFRSFASACSYIAFVPSHRSWGALHISMAQGVRD